VSASPLALGAKKVIDAAWLHGDAYDLSSQAAFALESAQLLMSPETAAEVESLRARVAELEAERRSTNESLSEAAEALRVQRDRIAELEALKPAAVQTCRKCGAGYTHGEPCSVCEFQARMAAETGVSSQVAKLRGILAGQREAVEAGEGS
jgi:hypothetical protein